MEPTSSIGESGVGCLVQVEVVVVVEVEVELELEVEVEVPGWYSSLESWRLRTVRETGS